MSDNEFKPHLIYLYENLRYEMAEDQQPLNLLIEEAPPQPINQPVPHLLPPPPLLSVIE